MQDSAAVEPPDMRTPTSPEAMGLSRALMEDILLRRCVIEGRTPMTTLADRLHVSINVVDTLLNSMRDRKLIEYDGMEGRAYVVTVTEAGNAFSTRRSQESRYAGPMPVSLDLYTSVVRAQRPHLHLDRDLLARSFSDLVIAPDLLDRLGPAIHGDSAMFLYGPPGTGKSSVAERIVRAYEDVVLIPYCVEVDGQIVALFDPTLHEPVDEQPVGMDRRFVACRRPAVVTGGELHAGMLDLALDRDTGVYLAPLQMKANNGVLVIDDFGRQTMTPEALLNRWIVPLDRAVDYLTLQGRKFEVPFELKVVLSTNLNPASLGDEAFFRRIHNKIYIGACTDEQFDWILTRVTQKYGMELDAAAAGHLRASARATGDGELRAYLPGVVCKLAMAITNYENMAPVLTPAMVDRVLDLYFTKMDADGPPPALADLHAGRTVDPVPAQAAAPADGSGADRAPYEPAPEDASALDDLVPHAAPATEPLAPSPVAAPVAAPAEPAEAPAFEAVAALDATLDPAALDALAAVAPGVATGAAPAAPPPVPSHLTPPPPPGEAPPVDDLFSPNPS